MSEPFLAEIRIFGSNFAPRGWAFCNGQLMPVAQNTALFSLIGTTYGGDGRTTTALPDLQGRAPMHPGRGPGLTARRLGEEGGVETVTLTEAQIPQHTHNLVAKDEDGIRTIPQNMYLSNTEAGEKLYQSANTVLVSLAPKSMVSTGGSQAHNNLQPYLTLNFIIALVGLYPSRS